MFEIDVRFGIALLDGTLQREGLDTNDFCVRRSLDYYIVDTGGEQIVEAYTLLHEPSLKVKAYIHACRGMGRFKDYCYDEVLTLHEAVYRIPDLFISLEDLANKIRAKRARPKFDYLDKITALMSERDYLDSVEKHLDLVHMTYDEYWVPNLTSMIYELSVPEEIVQDLRFKVFFAKIEENPDKRTIPSYVGHDRYGVTWVIKAYPKELAFAKEKASLSSAIADCLSPQLEMVPPGLFREPVEVKNHYITVQKKVSNLVAMPLETVIANVALLHRSAGTILRDNHVDFLDNIPFTDVAKLQARYEETKSDNGIAKFDEQQMKDAVSYLVSYAGPNRVFVHNDLNITNIVGGHFIDFDNCCMGHAGIDLSLVLMQYGVPLHGWSHYLEQYLRIRGVDGSFEDTLRDLEEGTKIAKLYSAMKENTGSAAKLKSTYKNKVLTQRDARIYKSERARIYKIGSYVNKSCAA